MELSISFKKATKMTSIKHNNRDFSEKDWDNEYHKHIDKTRTENNVILCQKDIKEMYKEIFGDAVKEYNAKQKRRDRRIKDYYSKVLKDKTLEPQREFIIQIGEMDDYYFDDGTLNNDMCKQANEILIAYYKSFQERNPNLIPYNAVIHNDEVTPHMHLNVIPVAEDYQRGVQKRPSFNKALRQQDIAYSTTDKKEVFRNFRDQEVGALEDIFDERSLERKLVGTNKIKDVHQFKREIKKRDELKGENMFLEMQKEQLENAVNESIDALNPKEYLFSTKPEINRFDDSVTIKQQDFYKLCECYNNFTHLSLKLDKSQAEFELEFNREKQQHKAEMEKLKQCYQEEIAELNELSMCESNFSARLSAEIDTKDERINELLIENHELKSDKNELQRENKDLKKTIVTLTERLDTVKTMFKDIVTITRENSELLKSTVSKFIKKQSDYCINRWDKLKEFTALEQFVGVIEDTFGDKSDIITNPVCENCSTHVIQVRAEEKRRKELERQQQLEQERIRKLQQEQSTMRRLQQAQQLANQQTLKPKVKRKQLNNDWEMGM